MAKKTRETSTGTIVATVVLVGLVGMCISSQSDRPARAPRDEAAFRAMRAKVCSPEVTRWLNQSFRIEVSGPTSEPSIEAFADPLVWAGLNYQTRIHAAEHLSACAATNATDTGFVTIRHGKTGAELAIYSDKIGYQGRE